jgi:hypothetical protein
MGTNDVSGAALTSKSNTVKSQGAHINGSMADYWLKKLVPYVLEEEKSFLPNAEIASAFINQPEKNLGK